MSNFKNAVVLSDFVLAIHNRSNTTKQIKNFTKQLHKANAFSVIMPKSMTKHIKCAFDISMDTAKIVSTCKESIHKEIYTNYEAVVVTQKETA
jgi:hypothetical protein